MVWPFGRLTVMPCAVGCLWSHGVLGSKKWLVQSESENAWELVIFSGTTEKALRLLGKKFTMVIEEQQRNQLQSTLLLKQLVTTGDLVALMGHWLS